METGTINCMKPPPELNDSQHQQQQQHMTVAGKMNNNNSVTNNYFHNEGDTSMGSIDNSGKKKKSPKHKKSPQQSPSSAINYKHLDEWLEQSLTGFSLDPTDLLDKICVNTEPNMMFNNFATSNNYRQSQFNAEPYSIPSEINYLNIPNSRNYSPQHMQPNYLNNYNSQQDFMSLPPGLPNLDSHSKKDCDMHVNNNNVNNHNINNNNNISNSNNNGSNSTNNHTSDDVSQNRRFSDPGLPGTSDNESKESSGNYSKPDPIMKESDKNKLLLTLLKQINVLHETNSKICRNLHETRVEMEALKHAPSWNLRHRRDSISGLSTQSQPLNYALGGQCHSPAPTYHSQGTYAPGMITDVIREVRETMRIREEALINRMKSLIDERSWSLNEANIRTSRELEELKIYVQQLRKEKFETNERLSKLEDEVKALRAIFSYRINYQKSPSPNPANYLTPLTHSQSFGERDVPRPVQLSRHTNGTSNGVDYTRHKRHSLNLNYGVINSNNGEQLEAPPASVVTNGGVDHLYKTLNNYTNDSSHSEDDLNAEKLRYQRSPKPNGTITTTGANKLQFGITEESEGQVLQYEKDALELRRELQEAVTSRKNAENKILALEKMVSSLKGRGSGQPQEVHIYPNTLHQSPPQMNGQHYSAHSSNSESSNSESPKPQKAMSVHTLASPKNSIMSASNISLKGPVTDL